jgi:hypothetical protein
MSRSRVAVLLAWLVVPLAALPATASAASVEVEGVFYKADHLGDRVVYRAGSGETNKVELTTEGAGVIVTDQVPIAPGPGCASEAATTVRCSITERLSTSFAVSLSDGNDEARMVNAANASLNGGAGDDLLIGLGDAPTVFLGGAGRDTMLGGGAGDTFEEGKAGGGSDTISGAGNGAEGYFSDLDRVSYEGRRSAVRVDLVGDRDDGAAGERDLIVADVESITGGNGPDVLTGGLTRNVLEGGPGRDTVRGRAGGDLIIGDPGSGNPRGARDRLFGGSGADGIEGMAGADTISAGIGRDWIDAGDGRDRVRVRDGRADVVQCGTGRDVAGQDGRDFLLRDCERTRRRHPPRAALVSWRDTGEVLTLLLACPSGRSRRCRGELTVDPGPPVPRTTQSFSMAPASLGWVYIRLEGRSFEQRVPPLEPSALELSSTNARGRVAVRRIRFGNVTTAPPLLLSEIPTIVPFPFGS